MTSPATQPLAQRLSLPTPGELGGWKLAINPVAQLIYLYLRRIFASLDLLLADFAAGRLPTNPAPTDPTSTDPTSADPAPAAAPTPRQAAARSPRPHTPRAQPPAAAQAQPTPAPRADRPRTPAAEPHPKPASPQSAPPRRTHPPPPPTPRLMPNDPIEQADLLARAVAPALDCVLITTYPDADTLDTLRPDETDLATAQAVARAVALAMHDHGVEILVQRADRGAFRRWWRAHDDHPDHRLHWIDRDRLLRGPAAWAALGLPPPPSPAREHFPAAPGRPADALIRAFDRDGDAFDAMAQSLLAAERHDIVDLALRKRFEQDGEAAADELEDALRIAAEAAPIGPAGWAELVALPVALPLGTPPDAEDIAQSLRASGLLPEAEELRLLPGWRAPDALAELAPGAWRRVLHALLDDAEPRDLPPGDTDAMARHGFAVLIGLRIDWSIPIWEVIAAADGLPDQPDDAPDHDAAFDRWRGAVFAATGGCIPLALVPPSQVAAEIADFLAEAGAHTGGLDDIRDFLARSRAAAGEELACHPQVTADGLDLTLYTGAGHPAGHLSLPADDLPAPPEDMLRLLAAMVTLLRHPPGH